jgi:hypothetical protein
MGWLFSKRVRVAKGTNVNLSKSGASVSKKVGPVTVNTRGKASIRVAPGLSLKLGGKKKKR